MNNKSSWKKFYSIFFLFLFFSMLLVQLLGTDLTLSNLSENYLWRKTLIEKFQGFKYQMGDRVYASSVVGKDGWLFFTENLSLQNYQRIDPLNVSNIKKLVNVLNQIDDKVSEYGGTFIVVVPPDKTTIYPQYMPEEIPVVGDVTSLDRLIERINKFSDIQIIDLRPVLIRASETSQVYYKTDTHWNCMGAFYSYEEILSILKNSRPALRVHTLEDFTVTSREGVLDLADITSINVTEGLMSAKPNFDVTITTLPDSQWEYISESLKVSINSEKDLPNLMVFHDSFYNACLSTFMETSFGVTISVPYNEVNLEQILEMIEAERPQVVMIEFVERFMDYFLWRFTD